MVFPWHTMNKRLPIWDAADFVLTTQKILERFDDGFFTGLKAIYLERGWRPIIFPSLSVPFFFLTNGQILPAVGLAQSFFVFLLAGYLYLFLRQTLSSTRALIGCLIIVSSKWIIDYSNVFYSELLWLAATAGVFYHFSIALQRSSSLHFTIGGIWLGLMVTLRPIETTVLSAIPVILLIFRGWKLDDIKGADIGLFVTQLFVASIAVWLLSMPERSKLIVVGLFGISAFIVVVGARRLIFRSPILGFLMWAEVIALTWHLPTIHPLYRWAYETSFGSLAKISDQGFSGLSPLSVFWELLQRYSPGLLFVLAVASLLSAIRLRRSSIDPERQKAIALIGASFLMIVPMLMLLSISGTTDMRRIMPGMLVLNLGMVALALSPYGTLTRVRAAILFLVMAVQMVSATANGLNIRMPILQKVQELTGYLRPPYTGLDPNIPVLDGILRLGVQSGRIAAYTYCYRDYANCERQDIPMFEPTALSTLAKERHLPIYVHFIGDLDFEKIETLSVQIKARGFDYVLIDMFDSPAAVNWEDPYVAHTKNFITLTRGQLPAGLVNRGCFSTLKRPICVIEISR